MIFNLDNKIRNESVIYIIQNNIDDRYYIGSTKNFYQRFVDHRTYLIKNKHPNKIMQNFANKYGTDSLSFNLLLFCDEKLLKYNKKLMMDRLMPEFNIREIEISEFDLYNEEIEKEKVCNIIESILENVDIYDYVL